MFNQLNFTAMTNLKTLLDSVQNLKGAKFITLKQYHSENGEVADHNILVNISVMNAKKTDLNTLKGADAEKIQQKSASLIALDIFQTALSEMVTSAEKNTSNNKAERTVQSQAQTDAYFHITNAIRLHKDSGEIHIFGFHNKKYNITQKGKYTTVNSSDKTLAKGVIKKTLKLRADKFRTFKLSSVESVAMEGKTLVINCSK
jgi:hypothetical protein